MEYQNRNSKETRSYIEKLLNKLKKKQNRTTKPVLAYIRRTIKKIVDTYYLFLQKFKKSLDIINQI